MTGGAMNRRVEDWHRDALARIANSFGAEDPNAALATIFREFAQAALNCQTAAEYQALLKAGGQEEASIPDVAVEAAPLPSVDGVEGERQGRDSAAHPVSAEGERAVEAFIEGFKAAGISQLSINGVRIYPPKTLTETHPHARVFRFEDDDV